MKKHEGYSVLITDEDKGRRGTGTLFYSEESDFFYILTCAHVIYTSENVKIQILLSTEGDPEERTVIVGKDKFHFSPIDEPTVVGDGSNHTCDIAIIECEKNEIPLEPTRYAMYPMTQGECVVAIGYPRGAEGPVYYQQDELTANVFRSQSNQNFFVIRIEDNFLNNADRESELEGFSGSPVWDKQKLEEQICLFGGLVAMGVGNNVSRGRVNVMNARLLQSLMKNEFGINIETRLPSVQDDDIAPGYEEHRETDDQIAVRAGWIENERRKAEMYMDSLQLQKAVDSTRSTIGNAEFQRCTNDQKRSIYAVLHAAYRLAGDYDIYDQISEEMQRAGISREKEYLMEAVRYCEAQDNDKAEEYINKALDRNPDGNEERILALAIKAIKDESVDITIFSEVLGPRDQLLIKPKNDREEEFIYQTLGYILSNRFHETTRALRCLNRAFQISGNYLILETLAFTYYQHSIRNAFIEEGKDKIDPQKIMPGEIDKARDAFLRVFSAADEMWLKGTFRRGGLQVFKCFFFMHDNFRIYKHYHDVMKYVKFPNQETKRDIQLCYIDVALRKEAINPDDFDALTEHDKKFYRLVIFLEEQMRFFDGGFSMETPISEGELLSTLREGESWLQELIDTQTDDRLGFDGLHAIFANLYGNGIMRFNWQAISEVERHCANIKNPTGIESFQIYIDELQTDDLNCIEKRYETFFEKHRDVTSFEEWCHFYKRHGLFNKAKELYDSVFEERQYLIEAQPEYFYRQYIDYTLRYDFNLAPALKCFIERKNEFKDIFIYTFLEMELKFATCTFNDPDQMLKDARILFDEGLYSQAAYDEKCLVINMFNCKPRIAEQYASWSHGTHPALSTYYEEILFTWKYIFDELNSRESNMQKCNPAQIFSSYTEEVWQRDPKDILAESETVNNRVIVVDLWALYFFAKAQIPRDMRMFKTIYVTHSTVSMALQEINQANDSVIRSILGYLEMGNNVKLLSPTLEQQLTVRDSSFRFKEAYSACLLAQELNCPALIGEFRYPIPENLRSKIIRPNNIKGIIDCINRTMMLEE